MGKLAFWSGVAGVAKGAQSAIHANIEEKRHKADQAREERLIALRNKHEKGLVDQRGTIQEDIQETGIDAATAAREDTQKHTSGEAALQRDYGNNIVDKQIGSAEGAPKRSVDAEMYRSEKLAEKLGIPVKDFLSASMAVDEEESLITGSYVTRAETAGKEGLESKETVVDRIEGVPGSFVGYKGHHVFEGTPPEIADAGIHKAMNEKLQKKIDGKTYTVTALEYAQAAMQKAKDKKAKAVVRRNFLTEYHFLPVELM